MKNGLVRRYEITVLFVVAARIEVSVDPREIAAGYGQSDTVSGLELVAGEPQVDFIPVDFSRHNVLGVIQPTAKAGTDKELKRD